MADGHVESIHLASVKAGPMVAVDEAMALASRGLEGDRYANAAGTYSKSGAATKPAQQVTLIEAEALEALPGEYEITLRQDQSRRNITTRGVALNHLVGRTFRAGAAVLRGVELCEPCGHMERLASCPGARKALVHRGGLRAEVIEGGVIRRGDAISTETKGGR